ncbi:MAG TPA: serine protease, partial [Pyrinomonadaceae bacterium]
MKGRSMLTSADAMPSEQYGPVSVDLRCDFPGSEVLLVDGQQRLIDRGVQRLKVDVVPGVYTARVLIGEALRDERIVVRPDTPFSCDLEPPTVSSAMPLTGSAKSHEYHQDAIRNPAAEIVVHADGDSGVFLVLREWTSEGNGRRPSGSLAPTLVLCSGDGRDLHAFNTDVADAAPLDRAAALGVRVRAGFYRLSSPMGDAVVEMPVYALADWQTQIYLLSQPTPEGLAPDFGRASVLWARPGAGFDPGREDLRVLESVRLAAQSGRKHLTDKGLTDALYEKYANPMLGLISAHALLHRRAIDPGLLAQVTDNLEQMLGPIPDVVALKLAVNPDAEVPPVELPPLLRWSWELLLQRSVDRPELIRRHSFAEQVSGHVIGGGIWMSWMTDAQGIRLGDPLPSATREVAANAVRQAWRQIGQGYVEAPRKVKWTAEAAQSSKASHEPTSARSRLMGIVQMLGVPSSLIEEAVGADALNAVVSADSPAYSSELSRGVTVMNQEKRKQFNERFLRRLLARRPQDQPEIEQRLQQEERRVVNESAFADLTLNPTGQLQRDPRDIAMETIVNRERPVLFVRDGEFDLNEVTALGPEALDLVDQMKQQGGRLFSLLPLIGRIDVVNFPNGDFVGTGWFVDTDIVVTNRHVASLIARWDGRNFAFTRGVAGRTIESSFCNAHEFDDFAPEASRIFKVTEVLYIEPDSGPHDIAFLKVERRTDGRAPSFIPVAASDAADEVPVCVIGYPARAPKRLIPDQELMKKLYRDRFDVKRAAPGYTSGLEQGSATHDCTTLGGNSGSVVLDLATGQAVGLHYAGLYEENNFAVRASVLTDYIRRKRWNTPPNIETHSPAPPPVATPSAPVPSSPAPPDAATVPAQAAPVASVHSVGGSVSITIPLTVTVSLGSPQLTPALQPPPAPQPTAAPVAAVAPAAAVGLTPP